MAPFARVGVRTTSSWFDGGREKKEKKEKTFKEVMGPRGEGLRKAQERRKQVSRFMQGKMTPEELEEKKRKDEERAKKAMDDPPLGSIIIPIAPFGMPEFDGGERFDLKGPYCDEGWVDEDADVGKKIANFFRRKKD
eukprot:scaffold1060_cov385-Pavlova_lutheri.AAC.27